MKIVLCAFFACIVFFYGCKKGGEPTPVLPAPSGLSYSTPNVFTAGSTIAALTPTVSGSVTSYTVSPALPPGLSINTITGVISGAPSAVTPQGTYTVTATNSKGIVSFAITITVKAPGQSGYVPDTSFKIVAYFPSYRNPDSVNADKYKMITHLYYAFLTPTATGGLNTLPEMGRFTKVISAARANGVKVGISLSGSSSIYITLAANASARTELARNVLAFVKQHNLDGVDMDWEYPRTTDGSDITYVALMKEMSDTLHNNNRYFSAAITPGLYSGAARDGIRSEVFAYADFFNIMVYDGTGWDSMDRKQHSSYRMAVTSFDYWLGTRGLPREKAIMGIPSYGTNSLDASVGYRTLMAAGGKSDIDSATYNGSVYYYNGTKTVKNKTMLAKQRGNGIMMWEFYFDTNGSNSLLKAVNDTLGRTYN